MTTESGATVNSYPSAPSEGSAFDVVIKMALRTAFVAVEVTTWNWKPVDLNNWAARYWPVCCDEASTWICINAVPGAGGLGCVGQSVNVPVRFWTVTGNGIRLGVPAEMGAFVALTMTERCALAEMPPELVAE